MSVKVTGATLTCGEAGVNRREFLFRAGSTLGALAIGPLNVGCDAGHDARPTYAIDAAAYTTVDRMVSFPYDLTGLANNQTCQVAQYDAFGYGAYTFGAGLPVQVPTDLAPALAARQPVARSGRMARFFTFSDVHITDKEAPNQLIHFQQVEPAAYANTSIYSPVMLYTTQVLDAAVQTVNALHRREPFDFGLALGDACNSTCYNELRWYIDVMDGGWITPSSGAHKGADSIDYQRPFRAAGLDPTIPWYQAMGNHDHFLIGSFPVDGAVSFRASYTADKVWAIGDPLSPDMAAFPALFDVHSFTATPFYYGGYIDGSTPLGNIVGAGLATDPAFAGGAPAVVADPDRRSLHRSEWIREFFRTRSWPVGHGFDLVDRKSPYAQGDGFACYSLVPHRHVPLKIIVLDNTQTETDGSSDIHGHGYLDADRWAWLQAELDAGQARDQLMIIAAHVPIGVDNVGTETEWWGETAGIAPVRQNAVDLTGLVAKLQSTPNLLLWLAGHRHYNTAKAFVSPDPTRPEMGFWQVETASLRDFPQQFRTFDVYLNDDDTVSVVAVNVDTAVAEGTPAAVSRKYAIAVQQIVKPNKLANATNDLYHGSMRLPTMDPSRPQDGSQDASIRFVDLSHAVPPVPYHASSNVELVKPLSPGLAARLRAAMKRG